MTPTSTIQAKQAQRNLLGLFAIGEVMQEDEVEIIKGMFGLQGVELLLHEPY